MSRILSAAPAAAVVVWAMVSLAPPAVANETVGRTDPHRGRDLQ